MDDLKKTQQAFAVLAITRVGQPCKFTRSFASGLFDSLNLVLGLLELLCNPELVVQVVFQHLGDLSARFVEKCILFVLNGRVQGCDESVKHSSDQWGYGLSWMIPTTDHSDEDVDKSTPVAVVAARHRTFPFFIQYAGSIYCIQGLREHRFREILKCPTTMKNLPTWAGFFRCQRWQMLYFCQLYATNFDAIAQIS